MCRSDVMWGRFGRGENVVRMALRAYRALRYLQASARKVERSKLPPVSVLWPVRCSCDSVP